MTEEEEGDWKLRILDDVICERFLRSKFIISLISKVFQIYQNMGRRERTTELGFVDYSRN